MADTLHFSKLQIQSEDIFEVVLIAAKRAKQINALRMAKYPLPVIGRKGEEDFEETPEEYDVEWDNLKKPATLSLDELMEGEINFSRHLEEEAEVEVEEKTEESETDIEL